MTKTKKGGIIDELSKRKAGKNTARNKSKKLEKTFQKSIDKAKVVWYNTKAVAKKGSTVIEN